LDPQKPGRPPFQHGVPAAAGRVSHDPDRQRATEHVEFVWSTSGQSPSLRHARHEPDGPQ
jgi:hypothetical protein